MIANGGSNGIYFAQMIRLPEEGLVFYMVTNESSMSANMILQNISQLYFQGKILQDALTMKPKTSGLADKIYSLIGENKINRFGKCVAKTKYQC